MELQKSGSMQGDSENEDLVWVQCVREDRRREQAFAALHSKYLDLILGFLRRKGFEAQAPDMAQEVFMSVFRDLESFEGRSTFRSWLVAVAANRCRQEWTSRDRQKRKVNVVSLDPEMGRSLEESVASPAPDPQKQIL